jgi:uncharacterized membrane-anchored protein YitT (DUF2179 family)
MAKIKIDEIKARQKDWMLDHPVAKASLGYAWTFLISTVSALCFAFGFNAFMDLGQNANVAGSAAKLVAGGVSGVSQVLTLILELCGWTSIDEHLAYSIMYFVINIPLIILAWLGIGKRFTVFTLINVAEVSLFIKLVTVANIPPLGEVATFVNNNGGLLARALFAGVCTGLSSALAFKVDISAGGIDILAYYIALKKNTLVGKYSVMLNSVTVVLFALLSAAYGNPNATPNAIAGWDASYSADCFARIFYSALYMLVGMVVVDSINVRNKKMKVEVVSNNPELGSLLISVMPHGATMVTGKGVYTGKERYIFTMVCSSYEVNDLVKLIRKEDPGSFVQVVQLSQVYGRFFVKPVK